jgi:hypothetical protein
MERNEMKRNEKKRNEEKRKDLNLDNVKILDKVSIF